VRVEQQGTYNSMAMPACVDAERAAKIFGWPEYFIPLLMRVGHLKPLGKPSQNSRKWFALVEIERLSQDVAWLDKAVRIVEKHVHENGKKRKYRPGPSTVSAVADTGPNFPKPDAEAA
jgi:hypothetical protein